MSELNLLDAIAPLKWATLAMEFLIFIGLTQLIWKKFLSQQDRDLIKCWFKSIFRL